MVANCKKNVREVRLWLLQSMLQGPIVSASFQHRFSIVSGSRVVSASFQHRCRVVAALLWQPSLIAA